MKSTCIVFLPVPENLRNLPAGEEDDIFSINPDIPIPVEIPKEYSGNTISLENLTLERILFGMLRVIEEKKIKQEWIDYYCNFIIYLRPDLIPLLKEIKGSTDYTNEDE